MKQFAIPEFDLLLLRNSDILTESTNGDIVDANLPGEDNENIP